ncbi:hypothetical protein [Desertivirga xinjiangensis]|nr:hypothetical protein [Pedobacter xinjiangensis]
MVNQESTEIPGLNLADLRLKGFKVHAIPAQEPLPVICVNRPPCHP